MRRLPNTPSQRWAATHGACLSGRRRLGRLSIGEYWRATPNNNGNRNGDLLWILTRLVAPKIREHEYKLPEWLQTLYNIDRVYVSHIRATAIAHDVTIPIELL